MTESPPLVWVLSSGKSGDDAQAGVLADALGWPSERKSIRFRGSNDLHFRLFGPSLFNVELARSAPLTPPWPAVVITIGRRLAPVALWIRRMSGNATKVVLIGRPRVGLGDFDLVLVTPQYGVPDRPNVLRLDLPLMRGRTADIAAAMEAWRGRLAHLPRPWTALLVGGPARPFELDPVVATRMMADVRQAATAHGGSLLVTTSRRTPTAVADALEACMPAGGYFYRWTVENKDNPYLALLGLADRFIVTADSVSMVVEVIRQGKIPEIYNLPRRPARRRLRYRLFDVLAARGVAGAANRRTPVADALHRFGILDYPRSLAAFVEHLVWAGLAEWFGDEAPGRASKPLDDLPKAVQRIRSLVG